METTVFPARHVRFKTLDPPRPRQMHSNALSSRTARHVCLWPNRDKASSPTCFERPQKSRARPNKPSRFEP
jgi:hypothetical protein